MGEPQRQTPADVWVKHDASNGTRGREDGDCTVCALATARDLPYSEAWQMLYDVQGETRQCSFRLPTWLGSHPERFGVTEALSFPAQKGKKRMTAETFCRRFPSGRYILRMTRHVAAVVDGRLYDTWDSQYKCVYSAWQVTEVNNG